MTDFLRKYLYDFPRGPEGAAAGGAGDAAAGGAAAGAGDAAAAAAAAAAAKPWYEGKADAEIVGHWQNRSMKVDDPASIAIDMTKAYRELEKFRGVPPERLITLPKPEDSDAWNAVHQRLGKPADAKEYDLTGVKFPDGTDLEAAFADTMRGALHKANVAKDAAPDVVKAVVKYLSDADAAEATELKVKLDAEKATLAKNWNTKPELLKDHPSMAYAKIGAQRLDVTPEEVAALEGVVGYSRVMEMFRKIGAGTREDTFVQSGQGGNVATIQGAAARVEELKSDPAWTARYLKGERAAVNEMQNLLTLIHGAAA